MAPVVRVTIAANDGVDDQFPSHRVQELVIAVIGSVAPWHEPAEVPAAGKLPGGEFPRAEARARNPGTEPELATTVAYAMFRNWHEHYCDANTMACAP